MGGNAGIGDWEKSLFSGIVVVEDKQELCPSGFFATWTKFTQPICWHSDVPKSMQNLLVNGPVQGKFDASLTLGYNGNLDLTLTLKVWLVQVPGKGKRRLADTNNIEFEADSWPSDE